MWCSISRKHGSSMSSISPSLLRFFDCVLPSADGGRFAIDDSRCLVRPSLTVR